MGLKLRYTYGQTPISEEEKEEILIPTISTRAELDEFEQANIEQAIEWSMKNTFSIGEVLSVDFTKELHKKMFSEVWSWAGSFRRSNKNLGVDKFSIEQELYELMDDCRFWIENNVYVQDETAIRFKYRMVSIHPFPNGNGRHSRICGDILVSHVLGQPIFSWGGKRLEKSGETRNNYLQALQRADQDDFGPLVEFARSGI